MALALVAARLEAHWCFFTCQHARARPKGDMAQIDRLASHCANNRRMLFDFFPFTSSPSSPHSASGVKLCAIPRTWIETTWKLTPRQAAAASTGSRCQHCVTAASGLVPGARDAHGRAAPSRRQQPGANGEQQRGAGRPRPAWVEQCWPRTHSHAWQAHRVGTCLCNGPEPRRICRALGRAAGDDCTSSGW